MARRKDPNESSQMREALQHDGNPCRYGRDAHDKENSSKHKHKDSDSIDSSLNQDSCSTPFSSSEVIETAAVRRRQAERNEPCKEEVNPLGCLLQDMKTLPQCDTKLGPLTFTRMHTVLIDVSAFNNRVGLRPQEGRDMWQSNFVKMPCSPSSFIVKSGLIKPTQVWRWEVISKQLKALASKSEVDVEHVQEAIMKYNPKYKGQWSFDALTTFVRHMPKEENYFRSLFPKIAELALMLPKYMRKAIPLLRSGQTAAITLSQVQISCLLANAFFCTFPHRNATKANSEYHNYPTINFTSLFGNMERKKEKLRAIMHYFKVVTETRLTGLVTFQRRCLKNTDVPNWRNCTEALHKLHVASHGSIEAEGTGMLQVDFAASHIGGGVLSSGLVQEEILFLLNPELIVSRLFTERLADNECLFITGSQQFSCYSGFGDTFEWAGPHDDTLGRDDWARLKRQIVAIDALNFRHRSEQYSMLKVTRELNKAYCGFKGHGHNDSDIATGKWGCGAFNGDPQLKALIQLMAAAKARRGLAFFTFGDETLKRELEQIYTLLVREGIAVGKLYACLEDYCGIQHASGGLHVDLFEFIRNSLSPSRSLL